MISRNTIDRIFEVSRVEEVIGEFVQLKKSGSNFKGLSPFTDERSPSFMVSPVKQIWKDFSSGKGGNAVSFLMEHEHYSYPEAIKFLAKKYNIEVEETVQSEEQKERMNERESMLLASNFAKDYFHQILLNHPQGRAIGGSYFEERGFGAEIIKEFHLGYCLDTWDSFTKQALEKGYDIKYLEATGLTITKEDKRFDRFRGRVLFPIHSLSGRVLGFGGRTLSTSKKTAKYVNSPESEIYRKSNILYGIYHAKKEIVKQDTCFLVEGYTDVISFYQSGVKNVVASSGTALTPEQIRLVKRFTENMTVLFDGDAAGIRASIRGIDLILEQGMNVQVVAFPKGEDPDSFAQKHSGAQLKEYLKDSSQDFINFKASLLAEQIKNDPIAKAKAVTEMIDSIIKIPNPLKHKDYAKICSDIMQSDIKYFYGLLENKLKNRYQQEDQTQYAKKTQKLEKVENNEEILIEIDPLFLLEKEIIRILLLYGNQEAEFVDFIESIDQEGNVHLEKETYTNQVSKELYLNLQEDEIEFSNDIFRTIYYEMIHQMNLEDRIEPDAFVKHTNSEISSVVTSILMDDHKYTLNDWKRKKIFVKEPQNVLSKLVTDSILNLRRILIDKKIQELSTPSGETSNMRIDLEMIRDYTALRKRLFAKLMRVV